MGLWHPLADHVRATADLARRFADPFGAGDLAAALGLMHDAGKAARAWQDKLAVVAGSGARVGVPHKELGAAVLVERAEAAALAVLGHHGGLASARDFLDLGERSWDVAALERFFAGTDEVCDVAIACHSFG